MEDSTNNVNEPNVSDVVENNEPSVSVSTTEMEETLSASVNIDDLQTQQQETETVEKIEMPEKFANAEDPMQALLKSYNELQKKISTPDEAKPAADEPEVKPNADESTTESSNVVTTAQDMWAQQGGKLTDEQWTDLESKTGIPMETLRAWEAHVKSELNTAMASNDEKIYQLAGGEAEYNKMIDWANGNLTDSQIDSLNAQLDNPAFSETGVAALKGLYNQAHGFEPKVSLVGKSMDDPSALAPGEFATEADFHKAMEHPEYGLGGRYDKEFDAKALRWMRRTGQA